MGTLTYLQLTNRVLQDLNETTLTTLSSSRGVQTVAKNSVNRAINDIVNSEVQWPFLFSTKDQDTNVAVREYSLPSDYKYIDWDSFVLLPKELVTNGEFTSNITGWTDSSTGTGSVAHTSSGDGRLRLTAGASGVAIAVQSLSIVKNKTYRISFGVFNGTVTLNIGTTSNGTEIGTRTVTVSDTGEFNYVDFTFAPTAATVYIGFNTTTDANIDVDNVSVKEDFSPKKLKYISYDEWFERYSETDRANAADRLDEPAYVYHTQNESLGLSPVPDKSTYTISYEYWTYNTELSADSDVSIVPTRYEHAIVARARYYVAILRSDTATAQASLAEYNDVVRRMRIELVNRKDYFRAV